VAGFERNIQNMQELKEGLTEALKGYEESEDTFQFYNTILSSLE
jgi:hypothetical protein